MDRASHYAAFILALTLISYGSALRSRPSAKKNAALARTPTVPVASFRLAFGASDPVERAWDGRLVPAAGQVMSVEADHFRVNNYTVLSNPELPNDQLSGGLSWKCSTRRAWLRSKTGALELQAPTLLVHIWRNPAGAPVRVETVRGEFHFDPSSIRPFQPAMFLEGGVRVERVPATSPVAPEQLGEQDFPSVLATRAGDVWVSWQEHHDGSDSVRAPEDGRQLGTSRRTGREG